MVKKTNFYQPTSAVKGTLYLSLSKLYFILSGYGIYFALTRLLTPEEFGIYSIAISAVSVINAVLINGTMQAVSKFVSEDERYAVAVKNSALKIQFFLGAAIFIIYFLCADLIAFCLRDRSLSFYLRLSSFIIIFYSLYAVFDGYLNGLKHFKIQACLGIIFSTVKLSLIVLLVWLGFSVTGAILGFTASAALIMAVSWLVCGLKHTDLNFDLRKIINFELWIIAFTLITNLLLNIDLFMLKALSDPVVSNAYAGYYTASLTIARIPYQAIAAVPLVVFPFISRATFADDKVKIRTYIITTFKYSYIFLAGSAVLISSNARELIRFLYTDKYLSAATALSILAFGLLLFSLFTISISIITASARPKTSVKIAILTFLAAGLLNYLFIPRAQLEGAASATGIAFLLGLSVCLIYIKRRFSVILPAASFLKISGCAAALYAASFLIKAAKLLLVLKLGVFAILYILMLFLVKEIKTRDLSLLSRR